MMGLLYETKKMMIYQKGIAVILIFLTLNVITLFLTDKPFNFETENYKLEYNYYLNKLNGECTTEKAKYIKNEAKIISDSEVCIEKLYNDFYDNKTSELDFETKLKELLTVTKNKKGFEEIHKQYVYARENIENRYFMDTNGWNGLISNSKLDFLLVITIVLLIVPVFCNEYSSKMDGLALTLKCHEKNYLLSKLLLSLSVVAMLCIASFIMRYTFYEIKYGLPNLEYPLQSLPYFCTSTKNISLISGYITICGLKLLGYSFFTIIILFISVATRKYSLSAFISIALIIIPYIGLDTVKKYIFPIPLSLILATGFLKGTENRNDFYTGEVIQIFKEPSNATLLFLTLISIVIITTLICFIRHKNKNMWSVHNRFKNIMSLFLCFFLSLSLFGCSIKIPISKSEYNLQNHKMYETDFFKCFVDLNQGKIIFEDKQTGKQNLLANTPFQLQVKEAPMIFGSGDYIYYIKYNMKETTLNMGEEYDNVAVVEVNTNTFEEKNIFERSVSINNDSIFSIGCSDNKWSFLVRLQGFFLDEKYMYFIDKDIKQVNRLTSEIKVIDVNTIPNISFDGENIYYLGERSVLFKYNIASKEHIELKDVVATRFLLKEQNIIYINRADNYKLHSYSLDTGQGEKIYDKPVSFVDIKSQKIIVTNKANFSEYELSWKSSKDKRKCG